MHRRLARRSQRKWFICVQFAFLLIAIVPPLVSARRHQRKFVLVYNDQEAKRLIHEARDTESLSSSSPPRSDESSIGKNDSQDDDEFADTEDSPLEDLDPGSWKTVTEGYVEDEDRSKEGVQNPFETVGEAAYTAGVRKMLDATSLGDPDNLVESIALLRKAALEGHAHAQSTIAFLYKNGIGVEHSDAKAFLYHSFAADGGNYQSKFALAYNYFRQQMNDKAVQLYAELAGIAVTSFSAASDSPLVEHVALNDGLEENKDDLRRSRGEDDDDFQILEYQARKGNAKAMSQVGYFYYSGLRGVRRDDAKALEWFLKAIEKGELDAMEFVGEIYAKGHGVERNYTKALEWFKAALRNERFSAYNGIGYLYVKGFGVEKRNYTMARDFFKRAADNNDPDGHYNLGVLYLKGKGVEKNLEAASKCFVVAANARHPKAYYQLAKLFQKGLGVKKDLAIATHLYKTVAEGGPWGSLMRWALSSYLKGEIGKALLLYSRAAELGYEIAQSNAAWILEKYQEDEYCLGESGFCKTGERYRRAHTFWWHASEQGNDDAALLIGDAYYYGRGTERDLERAASAYNHARLQQNAQAYFNLGYMHEHGEGLPLDFHLAKRYYDEAVRADPSAALPVYLALTGLWLRQHHQGSFLVKILDDAPQIFPRVGDWVRKVVLDEGNITLATLFSCLLTVLYLRRRRMAAQAAPLPPQPAA
ncbi:hypothetical protein KP509_14G087900 [Ceratopteris richardii]|uniref:ERAD-associated E3 ubiquitin-protein ligase component HRD3A n=1 Tax=Ceratopteris richardii TaxID=49495 RepID=A0A8T2TDW3_CERRI|nr:hypothetical protein KP509_14G087900 [Ceratopteris richardii]